MREVIDYRKTMDRDLETERDQELRNKYAVYLRGRSYLNMQAYY